MTHRIRIGRYVLSASVLGTALCFAATPQEVQKQRHEHYEALGDATKAVRDGIKASAPDFAALEKAAEIISKAGMDQMKWFPKGSGPEAGKTRAMAEIWSKPAEFAAAVKMFEERAPAVLAAVKAKDADAVNKALREAGGACKNCHDSFRAPE